MSLPWQQRSAPPTCKSLCAQIAQRCDDTRPYRDYDWLNDPQCQFWGVNFGRSGAYICNQNSKNNVLWSATPTRRNDGQKWLDSIEKQKQESCAIAKMNAQCALYTGALKIFGTPWLRPRLLFPTFFMGFCSDRPSECSYQIWSP